MTVDKKTALKVWQAAFGNVEWAVDCFGTLMNVSAYSNESVVMRRPGDNRDYDYSWNIDHIRPISNFEKESDANFMNNLEPMHRENNLEKLDNYPNFKIDGKSYKVVRTEGFYGYGIANLLGIRIDWKARTHQYFE